MNKEIDVLALAKQGLLSASHRLDSSDKHLRLLAKEEVDKILGLIELYASPQPVAFHRASFLSGYEAAQSDANFCDVPPQGWLCTRQAGHDGPCAAIADGKGRELVNRAMLRLAEQEPVIDLSKVRHEYKCCYWDDETFCNCGADSHALLEWHRNNKAAPVQQVDLTDEEELELARSSVGKSRHWLVAAAIAKFKEKNK